jgi:REP element-mobilizing transposase RayT
MRKARKRHEQLTLDRARKPDGKHGGWRPNAGRKKQAGTISHAARAAFRETSPVLVTVGVLEGVPSFARERFMKIIRKAIKDAQKQAFRVIEFNVLGNHLHLIVEAAGKRELACGMQGLLVRLVQRLNPALGRTGKLFAHRYHARALGSPREVRNALRYVLLNRKHHAAEREFAANWIDPYSSAMWFGGWAGAIEIDCGWMAALARVERPTEPPRTWLLASGWKRHGPLRFDERPA